MICARELCRGYFRNDCQPYDSVFWRSAINSETVAIVLFPLIDNLIAADGSFQLLRKGGIVRALT